METNSMPFQKGHKKTGGRQKGSRAMKDIYEDALALFAQSVSLPGGTRKLMSGKELLGLKRVQLALKGDQRAMDAIENRIEGMPVQAVKNLGGGKTKLNITFDRGNIDPKPLPNEEGSDGKPDGNAD
jgi:hypothetical protein